MNKHFKMTALAIVVSFGLTGCLTSNDSPADVKPATPIAKGEQGKPQTKPEESKPSTKPEESKPTTKPEESKPTTNPEETKPQSEPEKIVSVDSTGQKWRIVKMSGHNAAQSPNVTHSTQNYYASTLSYSGMYNNKHLCVDYGYECKGDAIYRAKGVNEITTFDLNELAQKDGKPFLGVHSGSFTDNDFSGYVIDAYTNEKGELVTTKEDAKTVNYLFVNQPYSSYGMLYTNQNDIVPFHQALRAGKQNGGHEFTVYKDEVVRGQETGRLVWNDNVKGNATYKGEVIATVATYEPNHFDELRQTPKVDGTITLNAQFGDRWERTYVSGELNSEKIGKVALPKANINYELKAYSGDISKSLNEAGYKLDGNYSAVFSGKDLNDVTGLINLSRGNKYLDKGDVVRYNAVFGATKQPKSE